MTKRTFIIIAILTLGLTMIGCNTQLLKDSMKISQAQLTKQESQILSLIKGSIGSAIFDYTADPDAKSVSVACYKLDQNGKWEIHSGWDSYPIEDVAGRIAVSFNNLDDGMRVAVQTGDNMYASENNSDIKSNTVDMGSATTCATTESIVYEEEIPLVIQVFTTKDAINTYDITFFNEPKEFINRGYSDVYVVVAKFSEQDLT